MPPSPSARRCQLPCRAVSFAEPPATYRKATSASAARRQLRGAACRFAGLPSTYPEATWSSARRRKPRDVAGSFSVAPLAAEHRRQLLETAGNLPGSAVEFEPPLEAPADRRQLISGSVKFGASPSNSPPWLSTSAEDRRLLGTAAVRCRPPSASRAPRRLRGASVSFLRRAVLSGSSPSTSLERRQRRWAAVDSGEPPSSSIRRRKPRRAASRLRRPGRV